MIKDFCQRTNRREKVYFLQIKETIQNWRIIDWNSASPSGGAWRRVLGLLRYSDQKFIVKVWKWIEGDQNWNKGSSRGPGSSLVLMRLVQCGIKWQSKLIFLQFINWSFQQYDNMERCHSGLRQKLMRPRWAGEGWEGRVSFCLIPLVIRQRSGNGLSFTLQPIQHAVSAVKCKTFLLWTDWRSCTVMAQFSSFLRQCKIFKIDTKYIVPWQARKKDEKWEEIKAGRKNTNKSIHKDTLWSLYYYLLSIGKVVYTFMRPDTFHEQCNALDSLHQYWHNMHVPWLSIITDYYLVSTFS